MNPDQHSHHSKPEATVPTAHSHEHAHEAPAPADDAATRALAEALGSSFKIVKFLMAALVVIFIGSGIFTVNPGEVAVILRFGRPVGVGVEQMLKPGLHWAFPYPIDEVMKIAVGQSRTVVGRAPWAPDLDNPNASSGMVAPYLRPGIDGCALTGDGNIIHARATLKYRLQPTGILNYAFNYTDVTNLLENVLNNSLYYAATHFTAEEAIFRDKVAFNDMVQKRLSQLIDETGVGVAIESLDVETSAPLDVRAAFNAVLEAQQTSRTRVSESETYARSTTNAALGQASVVWNDGITRSNQLVRTVDAEAKSFSDQLPYYEANPDLFKQRLLTETMQRVLTNAQEKFFIPNRADGNPRELRLQLNREPQKPRTETFAP